jgi:hypothetical protein
MEFASYLAGEAWSDHPACTHDGLAHLARMVNDCTTDQARSRLAPLIPSVIGLTSDDPRLNVILALRATAAALPIAAEDRQRSLAVGAIVCSDRLKRMGGAGTIDVSTQIDAAFNAAPAAAQWARNFVGAHLRREPTVITARHSHSIIAAAVDGIACACVEDPDDRLYRLLSSAIDDCIEFRRSRADAEQPADESHTAVPETHAHFRTRRSSRITA